MTYRVALNVARRQAWRATLERRLSLRSAQPIEVPRPALAMVAERAFRNLAGYGPLEPLLVDEDVWEIRSTGRRLS